MEPMAGYEVGAAVLPGCPAAVDTPLLTEREREVLGLLCRALPDKLIARRLSVSVKTVSTHLEHIYLKLGVRAEAHNARCAAMLSAFGLGLVTAPGQGR